MLILNPYPHVTIWGGVRLGKYINQDIANIGHLYTVRGTKSDSNVILNSEMKGMKLYHYFLENRVRWKLEEYGCVEAALPFSAVAQRLQIV